MGRFSDTLLSGFQTGWGMADGVRDRRARSDQQAFDNNMAVQNQQQAQARYEAAQTQQAWENDQYLLAQKEAADLRRQMVEERLSQKAHDRNVWSKIMAPDPVAPPMQAPGVPTDGSIGPVQPNAAGMLQQGGAFGADAMGPFQTPGGVMPVGGPGAIPLHPIESLSMDDIAGASPEVQRAYMTKLRDRKAFDRAKQDAESILFYADRTNRWKALFDVDQRGNISKPLQTIIDAGMIDRLPFDKVRKSVQGLIAPGTEEALAELIADGDQSVFEKYAKLPMAFLMKAADSKMKQREEQAKREQGAAALKALRDGTSTNRERDFATAREAGLVNQEAISISGRASATDVRKSPEFLLAQMDMDAAKTKMEANPLDSKALEEFQAAHARMREVFARMTGMSGTSSTSKPNPLSEQDAKAVEDALDAAIEEVR